MLSSTAKICIYFIWNNSMVPESVRPGCGRPSHSWPCFLWQCSMSSWMLPSVFSLP